MGYYSVNQATIKREGDKFKAECYCDELHYWYSEYFTDIEKAIRWIADRMMQLSM